MCMKWTEVTQSCPTLCDPMDYSPPGFSVHGIFQVWILHEYWSGLPLPSPGDLPDPGIEPRSHALQADALPSEIPGKPIHTIFFMHLTVDEHVGCFLYHGYCKNAPMNSGVHISFWTGVFTFFGSIAKATIIKIVWHCHKNRNIYQWNRIARNKPMHRRSIYNKRGKTIQWGKDSLFNK